MFNGYAKKKEYQLWEDAFLLVFFLYVIDFLKPQFPFLFNGDNNTFYICLTVILAIGLTQNDVYEYPQSPERLYNFIKFIDSAG